MPPVSRWFIRSALGYLALGFTLGALLLANKGMPFAPQLWSWLPVHQEWLLVGWFVQLIMGVAYWIFPRFGMSPTARGREDLAWLALGLVNLGVLLVTAGAVAGVHQANAAGRIAEGLAAVVMAGNIWVRTRASGISPM